MSVIIYSQNSQNFIFVGMDALSSNEHTAVIMPHLVLMMIVKPSPPYYQLVVMVVTVY